MAYGQILLVGENQEKGIPKLVLVQHSLELLAGLDNTIAIVAVNDEDDTLGVLEVMPPERADLVLTANIPHGELDVLVLNGLNVEPCCQTISALLSLRLCGSQRTDGGDGGDDFTELQLVEDCRLSGSVQADHQNTHLLLSP